MLARAVSSVVLRLQWWCIIVVARLPKLAYAGYVESSLRNAVLLVRGCVTGVIRRRSAGSYVLGAARIRRGGLSGSTRRCVYDASERVISTLSVDDARVIFGVNHRVFLLQNVRMQRSYALIATNLLKQSTFASGVSRTLAIVGEDPCRFVLLASDILLCLLIPRFHLEPTVESVT